MSNDFAVCNKLHCAEKYCPHSALVKNGFIYHIRTDGKVGAFEKIEMVLPNGESKSCSLNAARLLCYFLSRKRQILTKDEISRYVWSDSLVGIGSLPVLVNELRKLIAGLNMRIVTFRRVGYSLEEYRDSLDAPDIQKEEKRKTGLRSNSEAVNEQSIVTQEELDLLIASEVRFERKNRKTDWWLGKVELIENGKLNCFSEKLNTWKKSSMGMDVGEEYGTNLSYFNRAK